jgi:RNA 2',3'-cyclic 3'-phosphodiesterase
MIRAFAAIELDAATRAALAVQQFLLPLPHAEPLENLHLTLAFLGEVPERDLEAAHDALAALRVPPFALEFAGLGLFGGRRPRLAYAGVVASEPLRHLQRKVETAARRAGMSIEARHYLPHVTLGRFRPQGPETALRLERGVVDGAGFRAGPMPVTGFALYESRLSHHGARYEVLAQYPLG